MIPPVQSSLYNLSNLSGSHVKRVFGYARRSDYIWGVGAATVCPLAFAAMERVQPAYASPATYTRCLRLAGAIGLLAGAMTVYQRSCSMSLEPCRNRSLSLPVSHLQFNP